MQMLTMEWFFFFNVLKKRHLDLTSAFGWDMMEFSSVNLSKAQGKRLGSTFSYIRHLLSHKKYKARTHGRGNESHMGRGHLFTWKGHFSTHDGHFHYFWRNDWGMYNEPFDLGSTNTVCNDEICSSDSKRFKAMTSVIGMNELLPKLEWTSCYHYGVCYLWLCPPPPPTLHSEYESTSSQLVEKGVVTLFT